MGIEEYKFLTKTMEQIADCSGQLESAKLDLTIAKKQLRSSRDRLENANRKQKKRDEDIRKWEAKVRREKHESSELPSLEALKDARNNIDPAGNRFYSGDDLSISDFEVSGLAFTKMVVICYVIALPLAGFSTDIWFNAHPTATQVSDGFCFFWTFWHRHKV